MLFVDVSATSRTLAGMQLVLDKCLWDEWIGKNGLRVYATMEGLGGVIGKETPRDPRSQPLYH